MDLAPSRRRPRLITVIVLILAMVLAACASGVGDDDADDTADDTADAGDTGTADEEEDAEDTGDTEEAEDGEDAEDGADASDVSGELEVWHLQNHDPLVEQAIERFNEEYPDVTVTPQSIENDPYKTQLQTAMGTDAAPDVFHSWGGGWLGQFVDAGLVTSLDDTLEANPDWADNLAQSGLETASYDGSAYAAPSILGGVYFWYRTDIFEEHGLEPPATWEDLLSIVDTLNEAGVTPITLANATQWTGSFYYMYLAARLGDQDLFSDAVSREGSFAAPAYIEAGERIQELVEADAFNQGFNGLNYDTGESRALLWSGDAAMQLMGDWLLNSAREEAPDVAENSLDFFTFPEVDGGGTGAMVGGVNGAFSVNADSENQEAALALVRYLTDAQTGQSVLENQLGTPAVSEGLEVTDPFQQRFIDALNEAEYVQTYYDQELPPDLAATHLEVVQELFGMEITPEEAAERTEEEAAQILEE